MRTRGANSREEKCRGATRIRKLRTVLATCALAPPPKCKPEILLLHFRLKTTEPQNANQRSQRTRRKMPRRKQSPKNAHGPSNLPPEQSAKFLYSNANLTIPGATIIQKKRTRLPCDSENCPFSLVIQNTIPFLKHKANATIFY